MRVLVITPFYKPDAGPSAEKFAMLCEDLARLGWEVSVLCAVPHYPTGRVPQEFRGRLVWRGNQDGVDVSRVWVPSMDRSRLPLRLASFLCYQLLATVVGMKRRYDVVVASNPAFETGMAFFALGVARRKRLLYTVHEIYPDIGVKLGIIRHRAAIWMVDWMERFCFNRSDYAVLLSNGFFRETLARKNWLTAKMITVPIWTDTDFIHPLPRLNEFSTRWALDGSFVVMYAGNLGLSQGLEQIVEAARLLRDHSSIRFVFVGEGPSRKRLEELVSQAGLTQVRFIPLQPAALLPLVLASADVSLLTLKRGLGTDSVPSKCYSIMASGRPMIASIDGGGETSSTVQQAGCGLCVEPENPEALAKAILDLYGDEQLRGRMAAQGRSYVEKHHSRVTAVQSFHKLLLSLSSGKGAPQPEPVTRERSV